MVTMNKLYNIILILAVALGSFAGVTLAASTATENYITQLTEDVEKLEAASYDAQTLRRIDTAIDRLEDLLEAYPLYAVLNIEERKEIDSLIDRILAVGAEIDWDGYAEFQAAVDTYRGGHTGEVGEHNVDRSERLVSFCEVDVVDETGEYEVSSRGVVVTDITKCRNHTEVETEIDLIIAEYEEFELMEDVVQEQSVNEVVSADDVDVVAVATTTDIVATTTEVATTTNELDSDSGSVTGGTSVTAGTPDGSISSAGGSTTTHSEATTTATTSDKTVNAETPSEDPVIPDTDITSTPTTTDDVTSATTTDAEDSSPDDPELVSPPEELSDQATGTPTTDDADSATTTEAADSSPEDPEPATPTQQLGDTSSGTVNSTDQM